MEGSSNGLRKGAWTAEEDSFLRKCINKFGEGKWHQVPLRSGLNRCRKSCRLRWLNYLKPSIKRGKLSSDEVDLLLRLHKLLGNRWSLIAGRLPGRTANDVKNYWNTHLSKKHEPCRNTNKKQRNITSSSTTPVQKVNIVKPRPRSFSVYNGLPLVNTIPTSHGLKNNNDCENSITSNIDEVNDEIVKNVMDGDNLWWESILEESQVADAFGPEAKETEKSGTSSFCVEQLWSLLDGEGFGT